MNSIGLNYAYWNPIWDSDPLPFISRTRSCGFDILEINAQRIVKLTEKERDALKAAAREAGLSYTYIGGVTPDTDLASEDSTVRKRGIKRLTEQAQGVSRTGGSLLSGVLYSSWGQRLPVGKDIRTLTDYSVEGMKEAVKAAEDCEVIFGLEVVNRFEHYMMNTAEQGVAFVERVASPSCKLLLDTFHMNIEEDNLREAIVKAGKWLAHFHVGETNRRPPGRGRIPWPEVFMALREIEFQGPIVMEPFIIPDGDALREMPVYRDLLGENNPDEEATRSLLFLRTELQKFA
jgi:D-psicose/D-tagatose/L-ribulose 3-epimerase